MHAELAVPIIAAIDKPWSGTVLRAFRLPPGATADPALLERSLAAWSGSLREVRRSAGKMWALLEASEADAATAATLANLVLDALAANRSWCVALQVAPPVAAALRGRMPRHVSIVTDDSEFLDLVGASDDLLEATPFVPSSTTRDQCLAAIAEGAVEIDVAFLHELEFGTLANGA